MRQLVLLGFVIGVVGGCGGDKSSNTSSDKCNSLADSSFDPVAYLAWRTSTRASRYSSITHALPCSTFVADGGSVSSNLEACGVLEREAYYVLIGKYNQFIAGWDDVVRTDTNSPVQPTDIDSVESFSSQKKLAYEDCQSNR